MSAPRCPSCGSFTFLDSLTCRVCGVTLGYHYPSLTFYLLGDDGALVDGERWVACANREWRCNWLVKADDDDSRCFSCRMTRRRPEADDTIALERLAETGVAKRRLLQQLHELGLPVIPYWEKAGGLAFDLLSSLSGEKVVIGHANGVITIDLAESLDTRRERLRVQLGEPYRTMLGHFRHEIGHYYQQQLVVGDELTERCRQIFGDERASYADALARHYEFGAPHGWEHNFISAYATMHPWEDFAESWAHYMHITATVASAAHAGLRLDPALTTDIDREVVPLDDYRAEPMSRLLDDWSALTLLFNRVNRSMGQRDLYPFTITEPVARKLTFIHHLVLGSFGRESA